MAINEYLLQAQLTSASEGNSSQKKHGNQNENIRTIVIFTSKFDQIVGVVDERELENTIFHLHELKINLIIFGYQVGTHHRQKRMLAQFKHTFKTHLSSQKHSKTSKSLKKR